MDQLLPIGRWYVQMCLAGRLMIADDGVSPGERATEQFNDVLTDFVTTDAGSRSNRSQAISGVRAKFVLHPGERFLHNPRMCAAPAGMDGCDGASLHIGEQDRYTVGCLYAEQQSRLCGDECITCVGRVGVVILADGQNISRMSLSERDQLHLGCAHGCKESLTIVPNATGRIGWTEA